MRSTVRYKLMYILPENEEHCTVQTNVYLPENEEHCTVQTNVYFTGKFSSLNKKLKTCTSSVHEWQEFRNTPKNSDQGKPVLWRLEYDSLEDLLSRTTAGKLLARLLLYKDSHVELLMGLGVQVWSDHVAIYIYIYIFKERQPHISIIYGPYM